MLSCACKGQVSGSSPTDGNDVLCREPVVEKLVKLFVVQFQGLPMPGPCYLGCLELHG